MCYVKFGRSASKGVRINKWEPQKLVSAALASPPCSGGIVDPLESWPSPIHYPAECDHSTSNGTSKVT